LLGFFTLALKHLHAGAPVSDPASAKWPGDAGSETGAPGSVEFLSLVPSGFTGRRDCLWLAILFELPGIVGRKAARGIA